jgi:hypothetical protein
MSEIPAYPIDITPTLLDVAALLRARTKDSAGYEGGTFNDDTRPTSAQVLTLIDQAVADVKAWLGPTPPAEIADAAKVAAALDTACLIELSYYPEQVQSNRSAYPEYKQLLDDKVSQLQAAARGLAPGGSTLTSTRIEVPWIDFIPASPVPLAVTDGAEAA